MKGQVFKNGTIQLNAYFFLLIIILIFFGPSKLPQLGQSLGKAIRGITEGIDEIKGEFHEVSTKAENAHANTTVDEKVLCMK